MTNPTPKYRRLVLIPSAAILLLMVSGAVVWRMREPELLKRAHKAANVSAWWSDTDPIDTQFMAWTTNTQLFAIGSVKVNVDVENAKKGDQSPAYMAFPVTDAHRLPFLYDTRNHHRTDLTNLAGHIHSMNDPNSRFDVAPDGRHIAWTSYSHNRVDVSRLDGSDRKTWRISLPTDIAWERDSKHWRALGWQSEPGQSVMTTGNIDSPGVVTPPEPQAAFDRASKGVHDERENEFQVDLVGDQVASGVSDMRAQTHTRKLKAPEGTTINDLIVSPDGRYIAWELQSLRHRDLFQTKHLPWLARMLGPPTRHRMELWISKADGTDMHELGYCPLEVDAEDDSGPKLILWQPDNRHLSFVYKGFLYVVGSE